MFTFFKIFNHAYFKYSLKYLSITITMDTSYNNILFKTINFNQIIKNVSYNFFVLSIGILTLVGEQPCGIA